ncbi:MAG: glycogen synthase [Oscillospiraceae bacterium]
MKNILFVASECEPFIKTGGLADVVGSLPKSIDSSRYDVRVIIPNYKCIKWELRSKFEYLSHFYMDMGKHPMHEYVGIMTYKYEGITYYFVDNEKYFGGNTPYTDNLMFDMEKYFFFCKAVLAIMPVVGFRPDIIHCHDWQAGLVPVYMRSVFTGNDFYRNTKAIMTIHNLKFQGVWDIQHFKYHTDLPDYLYTSDKLEFTPVNPNYKKNANMLKGGLVYSDIITTVSDSYAREIQTAYYGEGLDGLMRARDNSLVGIVNGIDYDVYNPEKDNKLYKKFGIRTLKNKAVNKTELQKQLGLPVDSGKMMIGIISRLTDQKGLDLVKCVMDGIADSNVQFVIIGTGTAQYENYFKWYQSQHRDRVSANIFYSDDLAHKLYGAADAMLMPSLFEPCGLTQLISLRYGTLPIVRETGGLKDTVKPYNRFEGTGTGFSFTNYNAHEMLNTINYAKHVFFNTRDEWDKMVVRGMKEDFSWGESAKKYQALYDRLSPQ